MPPFYLFIRVRVLNTSIWENRLVGEFNGMVVDKIIGAPREVQQVWQGGLLSVSSRTRCIDALGRLKRDCSYL